jgi:hypothetical protein
MQFLDVDFNIEAAGRLLGTLPRNDRCGSRFPVFEDVVPELSQSQWPALIAEADAAGGMLDRLISRIFDQGQEGSCASNATGQSDEIVQTIQFGKENVVHVSAISLYKRVGDNSQSGSLISDNLKEIAERGILPLNSAENKARFPHTMPATGFSTPFPSGWEETAKRFRVLEWYDIATTIGCGTALLLGWPIVYGRQAHSICGARLVLRNGVFVVKYANSWGDWGDAGYGYDTLSSLDGPIRSYGAFAPRAMVAE